MSDLARRGPFIKENGERVIVAPIAFAGLNWLYFARFAYTKPLTTALLFLAIVVALDVFVVALLIERSFAVFASPLGTWAPLFLIFASTWAAGALVERRSGGGKAFRSPGGGTAIPRR